LVVIVLLTAGYEGVRQLTRRYEAAHEKRLNAFNTPAVGGKLYILSMVLTMRYIQWVCWERSGPYVSGRWLNLIPLTP
jgi:hypothetical protein